MKSLLILFLLGCVYYQCKAGDGEYAVNKISADLLKNANAVKRFETISF